MSDTITAEIEPEGVASSDTPPDDDTTRRIGRRAVEITRTRPAPEVIVARMAFPHIAIVRASFPGIEFINWSSDPLEPCCGICRFQFPPPRIGAGEPDHRPRRDSLGRFLPSHEAPEASENSRDPIRFALFDDYPATIVATGNTEDRRLLASTICQRCAHLENRQIVNEFRRQLDDIAWNRICDGKAGATARLLADLRHIHEVSEKCCDYAENWVELPAIVRHTAGHGVMSFLEHEGRADPINWVFGDAYRDGRRERLPCCMFCRFVFEREHPPGADCYVGGTNSGLRGLVCETCANARPDEEIREAFQNQIGAYAVRRWCDGSQYFRTAPPPAHGLGRFFR